jgi:hypothetical protein
MESFVSQYTSQLSPTHEIEARLGTFTHQGFVPGVHKSTFYKLKSRMDVSSAWDKTSSEKTRDVITGKYRNHHHENTLVTCTKKQKIASKDFDNVRISVCEEIKCEPVDVQPTSFIRHKERWSYFKGIWRYDLTHVTTANKDVYEIEIELNDTKKALGYSSEYLAKSFVKKVNQII